MACTIEELVADSASQGGLGQSDNEALYLAYLAKTVNALGGGNYTDLDTLRAAVKCWCAGGLAIDAFKARVAIDAAVNADAVTEPTTSDLAAVIKCWNCGIGGLEREAMEVFLLCKLLQL